MDAAVQARLRNGGADRLADLLLNDILDRPLSDLLDPKWAAQQLASAARVAAADRKLEQQFRAQITHLRRHVPAGHLPVPAEVRRPLEEVLGRNYTPDRLLVGRLLDHDAARALLKTTFQDMLVSFGRKLKPMMPSRPAGHTPFGGRLGKLSEGVMGVVGQEVERQLEDRAREFMEAGIQRLVGAVADHVCDPRFAQSYGSWRVHMLDVFLSTSQRDLAAEVEKLDPDALVSTGVAILRAFVGRAELVGEIEGMLREVLVQAGGRSLREVLLEAGSQELTDQGLTVLRDLLRQRTRAVVETPAFALWWDEMVGV